MLSVFFAKDERPHSMQTKLQVYCSLGTGIFFSLQKVVVFFFYQLRNTNLLKEHQADTCSTHYNCK